MSTTPIHLVLVFAHHRHLSHRKARYIRFHPISRSINPTVRHHHLHLPVMKTIRIAGMGSPGPELPETTVFPIRSQNRTRRFHACHWPGTPLLFIENCKPYIPTCHLHAAGRTTTGTDAAPWSNINASTPVKKKVHRRHNVHHQTGMAFFGVTTAHL